MSWYSSVRRTLPLLLACVLAVTQLDPTFGSFKHADAARSSTPQAVTCAPAPLGPASAYNAFILGDATQTGSDTQGLMAVGGNASLTDYAVGEIFSRTVPSTDVLTVGGSLHVTRGAILGNAVYGTSATLSQVTVSGAVRQGSPIDFNAAGISLSNLANEYAGLPANGAAVFNHADGNYNLTSTAQGLTVFAITETIPDGGIFRITGNNDGQSDQTFLINVSGADDRLVNLNFSITGISPGRILFNIPAARTLTISGDSIAASILAPHAAVDFASASIEGTLAAGSLGGNGQFDSGQLNQPPFNGCLPSPSMGPTPSPVPTTPVSATTVPAASVPSSIPRATTTAVPTSTSTGTATSSPTTTSTGVPSATVIPTSTNTNTAVPTSTNTNTPVGGGVTAGVVRAPTSTPTPIKAGVTRPYTKTQTKVKYVTKVVTKTQTKVKYVTKVVTKTRTVVMYKTITRYKYVTITRIVTKVKVRNIVNHKVVITYKTVVKPVTKVTYHVVTVVHHVTKVTEVKALRIVRHPVTGRFGGPQQVWHGAIPPVEARFGIARLGISWAPVWSRDFIQTGWNAFTYNIVPQYGVTRFSPSARFGQPGLSMLSGHDDIDGKIFRNLGSMRLGDAIVVNQGTHVYRYIVTSVRVVTPDNVAMLNAPYARPSLALISCTPYMVDTHRVVVIAQIQH